MQGRQDEVPNQELAQELAGREDEAGIAEIAAHLFDPNPKIASDCLKVLYETGYIQPGLITGYWKDFLRLLQSVNNRMVWGAMIALGIIAPLCADELFGETSRIYAAIEKGSVITIDNGVKTLAGIAAQKEEYRASMCPYLFDHLRTCRAKEIPQHAESIAAAVNDGYRAEFIRILKSREYELTESQRKRVQKLQRIFQ
jgi:hypothetical protein